MINRKTKRHSPPPFQTTIATIDNKLTDSFSKWSKMLQLISPPNKKRRSISVIQQESWSSDDDDDDHNDHTTMIAALKKEMSIDQINKQKILNRRAMYIPNPPPATTLNDGPKDASHQWTLYRATCQKLRQSAVPLSETIHLRKMLVVLQPQQLRQKQDDIATSINSRVPNNKVISQLEDEEDDIPLGTLLEKNKCPTTNHIVYQRYLTPTFYNMPYYQPQQPYYYYNNTAQFI